MVGSLIGRLGQFHFIISFPSFEITSFIWVMRFFAVNDGPVRLDRYVHVQDRSRQRLLP